MIPRISQALADLAAKLAGDIAPETSSRFAFAGTSMIAMLLGALSRDAERAVANRMADVDAIKRLFEGLGAEADPQRAAAREAFATRSPASLALADVDTLHADGMQLVIALHAWAEEHDPALDRALWQLLLDHTERNRLD